MRSNVLYGEPLLRVGIQNFLDEVSCRFCDDTRDEVVAIQDFLVQLGCIGIFKR